MKRLLEGVENEQEMVKHHRGEKWLPSSMAEQNHLVSMARGQWVISFISGILAAFYLFNWGQFHGWLLCDKSIDAYVSAPSTVRRLNDLKRKIADADVATPCQ